MASLFDPVTLGALGLRNRMAMAPLTRNRSPGSVPGDLSLEYYRQRATAGLIISEATAISPSAQGYAAVPGLYTSEQLAGWRRVTDAVHAAGGVIFAQLWHVGRISHVTLQPYGRPPVAPSAIRAKARTYLIQPDGAGGFVETSQPRELTFAEIRQVIDDYGRAADAAVRVAGFDGVELHAANGYLVDQFLRSSSNHRTDDYGGPVANRCRFLFEVADALVGAVGADRVGIRLSPVGTSNDVFDAEPQPLFDHAVRGLGRRGLGYLHIVRGTPGKKPQATEGAPGFDAAGFDYDELRRGWRESGGDGLWMLNNGYDRDAAKSAIESGEADMISFGRAFLANPDLVRRFALGAPLNEPDVRTFYGGGAAGFTDYPPLNR